MFGPPQNVIGFRSTSEKSCPNNQLQQLKASNSQIAFYFKKQIRFLKQYGLKNKAGEIDSHVKKRKKNKWE